MSDLESFSGFDSGANAMDPRAFEKFKERMAAAAAQLKAIQAGEQRQKKTEDELIKILLKFIQTGQKRDILLLVSRLLEENVPAGFIISLLLISNQEMQKELGLKMLPGASDDVLESSGRPQTLPDHYIQENILPLRELPEINSIDEAGDAHLARREERAYREYVSEEQRSQAGCIRSSGVEVISGSSLRIKIAIDNWIREILRRSSDNPHRILKTILDPEGFLKLPVIQLSVFSLRDFLDEHKIESNYDKMKEFMQLMLENIVQKLQEQIGNTKELKEGFN